MADGMYILPAARELFNRHGLSDFDSVMDLQSGMTVSRHRFRDTALIMLGDGGDAARLFLKRVYRVPIKHVLQDLLTGRPPRSQPLREWHAIKLCEERGIGVMRGLAWGQRSVLGVPRQAFLVVEAVPAMESLDEILGRLNRPNGGARFAADRRDLARELGAFVAGLHRTNLAWPDLMGKHIYVAPNTNAQESGRWRFFLIDVERMTAGATKRTRAKDLARLLRSLRPNRLSVTDLMRFARSYLGWNPDGWSDDRARVEETFSWVRRVVRRSWASRRPRLPMPDDAAPPDRQRFVRHGRLVVNEAFIPLLQENGLVSCKTVFGYQDGERLDKPNIGTWRERWRIEPSEFGGRRRTLYMKRYQRPPLGEQLRRILLQRARHGTAWWEWHNLRRLAYAGIPTATVVAYGQKMRGILERRSFLITEAIPGESLERWVPEHLRPGGDVDWRTRRGLIDYLARLVRMLHNRRLVHRDLYLSHVFISFNGNGQPVLRLIDLQRLFRPRWRWRRWQVKDLAALHYSTPQDCVPMTDRIRFLRRYLGVRRLRPEHRRLIRSILARTRRTERHNRPR